MLFPLLLRSVVHKGSLKLTTADGKTRVYGDGTEPRVAIKLHRRSLAWSLGFDPDLRIGEAYTDGTLTIEGFRRSSSAVAAFRFGSVANSYAALTSGDRNVGVIGVAVFAERSQPVPRRPTPVYTNREIEKRETADPFPRQYAQPPRPRPMLEAR